MIAKIKTLSNLLRYKFTINDNYKTLTSIGMKDAYSNSINPSSILNFSLISKYEITTNYNKIDYTIKLGDTPYKIAKSFNISLEELVSENPDIHPINLQIGDSLRIPRNNY